MTPVAQMQRPLPHILAPIPGESLLGFGVRLMRANRLPDGFAAEMLAPLVTRRKRDEAVSYASGQIFNLELLARLSGNRLEDIEGLTFLPVLRRLYGTETPSIRSLGRVALRLCPACLAAPAIHRLAQFLPAVSICEVHGLKLRASCACGLALSLASESLGRCRNCHRRWSELDAQEPTPDDLVREERLRRAYKLAFEARSGPGSLGEVLGRLRDTRRAAGIPTVPLGLSSISIERMTALFIALGGDEDLIGDLRDPQPGACPNAACPRFDLDRCTKGVETHCAICGTRFIGTRILSTFDLEHGQASPPMQRVRKARRRLGQWRRALRQTCREMAKEGRMIKIADAFARAGIPNNANLRAPRLGLTTIVRSAEARRRDEGGTWRYVLPGRVRWAVLTRDVRWLSQWVRHTVDRHDVPDELRRHRRASRIGWPQIWT